MGLHSGGDISGAIDTAERREAGGDPIIRKLKIALPDSNGKYGGTKKEAVTALATITRIGNCLAEVCISPVYSAAWNGRMKCTTGRPQPGRPRAQGHGGNGTSMV
jgi:hypothetical protein